MTTNTPQAKKKPITAPKNQQTEGGNAPARPAPAAPGPRGLSPDQAANKMLNILNPSAKGKPKAAPGQDILADGKQKLPPKAKKPAPKAATQPKKAQPEADDGHPDDATEGLEGDDAETGHDDDDLEEGAQPDHDADEEADDGETSEEEGQDDDADSDEVEDDGTLYTVKVNGQEEEVTLSELLKGYSRTRDYQQKTAVLAKEKREVETIKESVKDLPQQREGYVKGAERFTKSAAVMLMAMQHKFMPKPPDPALAQTDPGAFYAAKEAHQDAMQFNHALETELGQIHQKLEADAKTNHSRAVQEGRKKLYEVMPEMNQAPARQKLREYANSLGFSDEQIAQEANHALFVCVEKARRWDELQTQKANMKPKAPVQKVARRTNAAETKRASHQRQKDDALANHKKKGTVKTAESALFNILSEG